MKKLLNIPLLPEAKVTTAVLSGEYTKITEALTEIYGINVLPTNKNIDLEPSISNHADCDIVQLDKNTILINKKSYEYIVNYLTSIKGDILSDFKVIMSENPIKSPYPSDIGLNVKVVGNNILCNAAYIDPKIADFAAKNNIKLLHSNQGYVACSTILLNDNALITDDESIYNTSVANGIDCLLISKGSVKLKGHSYGFIGGTCGMIDKNVLAFTGRLNTHIDADKIIMFLNKYNVSYVELTDGELIDIGGIIPIFEEI